MRFVLRLVRLFLIHRLDFEQREETFLVFRRTNLAGDQVAGLQIEAADLRWRNVNIFRAREVIETLRAQETKTFRQNLQHTFRKQDTSPLRVFLEDVMWSLSDGPPRFSTLTGRSVRSASWVSIGVVGGRNSELSTGGGSSTATAAGASIGRVSGNGSSTGPFFILGFFVTALGIVQIG